MIKSMTGFGHAEKVTGQQKITVELKSVNHRYLDLNIKMPKRLSYFEGEIQYAGGTGAQPDEAVYAAW